MPFMHFLEGGVFSLWPAAYGEMVQAGFHPMGFIEFLYIQEMFGLVLFGSK